MEWSVIDNREEEEYIGVEQSNPPRPFFADYTPLIEISNTRVSTPPVDICNFIQNNKPEEIIANEDDSSVYYEYFSLIPTKSKTKPKNLFQVTHNHKLSSITSTDSIDSKTQLLSTDATNINTSIADASISSITGSPQKYATEQLPLISNDNNICIIANLSHRERIRMKREKVKNMLKQKTERNKSIYNFQSNNNNIFIRNNQSYRKLSLNINDKEITVKENKDGNKLLNIINNNSNENLSKKEIKMLRNRFSAQQSRDRKKKEFDELKILTQNLIEENSSLKKKLQSSEQKIQLYESFLNQIYPSYYSELFNFNSSNPIQKKYLTSLINKKHLNLFTGLFTIFCVVSSFITSSNQHASPFLSTLKAPALNDIKTEMNMNINTNINNIEDTTDIKNTLTSSSNTVSKMEKTINNELDCFLLNKENINKVKPLFRITRINDSENKKIFKQQIPVKEVFLNLN
jgi:hypothetical protein